MTVTTLAIDSIRANKLRSFLTLLGVMIGVASVIVVGAAIEGLGVYAEQVTAKAFGTDSFLIARIASVGQLSSRQLAAKQRYNKQIQVDDLAYLRETTGDSIIYSPYQQRFEDVKADNLSYEAASVIGVSYTIPEIRDIQVASGRFFTPSEEQERRRVTVIGDDIRNALFGDRSPLDLKLKISGVPFTIVGLLEHQGSSFGTSLDNPIYIPAKVYQELFGARSNLTLFGRARPGLGLTFDGALDIARASLRGHFHTRPGRDDNFDTLTPDSMRSFSNQIVGAIAAVVLPVTGVSLLVGGVVIMNMMLVSVTERTREIGIRKSLGARQSDIMLQFLIEAVFLSLAGGLFGVIAGAVTALALSMVSGAALRITAPYVVLSIIVSSAVGIAAGWYPARRAARLDPVVALRAE